MNHEPSWLLTYTQVVYWRKRTYPTQKHNIVKDLAKTKECLIGVVNK